ncbi:hypothetical protein PG990_010388 [Apiospora arundinis]|uniref:P-loop containing nucleoside triphosphate hydrolase protein n=1 Tax=Apiospora arundinis TaxID=335852 RepID=A0ABR2IUU5_9PEZI
MARTKQTARRTTKYDYEEETSESDSNESGSESGSDSEDKKAKEEKTQKEHAQVLEGVEVMALAKNSSGASEASKLGYASKLVSNWYHHQCQYNSCQIRWSEFAVVDDEEADLQKRALQVPIVHRHEYRNKHWVTTNITVQDEPMRKVLDKVLHKYQDLDLEVINYTFEPPFMPLVHRWDVLKAFHSTAEAGNLKNAATALLAFLTPVIASSVLSHALTKKTGKVNFDNIWQIFPPNELVITKFFGVDTICRVVKYRHIPETNTCPAAWLIDIEYVDWNGEASGFTTTSISMRDFDGFRRVQALPVYPISFLPDVEKTKATFIERGRKFESLRGYKYMICNGTKITLETEKPEQRPVAGKVCVDAYAYYRSCNIVKPKLRPLSGEETAGEEVEAADPDLSDTPYEMDFSAAPVEVSTAAKGPAERTEDLHTLTDEQCLLSTPWMKGFDMKSKEWCELQVSELKDMTWNDEAFEKLVLPDGEKDLAWAFVENKSLSKTDFDDFIPDKGRGLIILMFGPPGVGKTFTAEAVAERSRVPLYLMSAGDLGTKPSDVEKALERALELCRMWNAMLLLDEADVFLGTRTNESLARNELVSIFLTKLEYYQGILFLTTNRISSIDHAFQSRVDLFLPYHDLTNAARRQVWENFIDRAGRDKFDINDESLEKLSQLNLNGREIKNLIKSAQLLSLKSGGKVPMDRLYMLADKRVQALNLL